MSAPLAVLQLLYYFLPAYVANMMPVIGKDWLPALAKPIDGGTGLLGSHKTWRGVVLGVLGGIVTAGAQAQFAADLPWLVIAPYRDWLLLGFLMGLGALLGDAAKSFFKRRAGIKPGAPWVPFDQLDFVIGGLALSSFVYFPGWAAVTVLVVASFFLHILVNHIAYWLRWRTTAW